MQSSAYGAVMHCLQNLPSEAQMQVWIAYPFWFLVILYSNFFVMPFAENNFIDILCNWHLLLVQATALEVQRLLVSGRKKEALEFAQEGQLWGPALVIASQLGDQVLVITFHLYFCSIVYVLNLSWLIYFSLGLSLPARI